MRANAHNSIKQKIIPPFAIIYSETTQNYNANSATNVRKSESLRQVINFSHSLISKLKVSQQ
jgi:hypothetical protein